ncbi:histidine kinase [Nocardioidaceae bacterium Broad-1]|uniref:sensor histidine kinase n=1 Tax=Nocardioides luteus TaxID=1844 RepID=UPI0002029549|nr:ATP-binding protein [Nocardioides luteus]EGD41909.1 histidine kinase [Nocardioidaceae bacterium Broad-1]MBG6096891.1 signal transduction histidine kinase [Nocardioides luteus]
MRILPNRLGLRARLTLTYAGLFLLAGGLLLAVTYGLFVNQLDSGGSMIVKATRLPGPGDDPDALQQLLDTTYVETQKGDVLTGPQARDWLLAQRQELQSAAAESLLIQGAIALVVVLIIACVLGWFISGRVLAPLHTVTATAHRISAAPAADMGLGERIELKGPDDEVKELADAFDAMVGRLDRSFAGQRRFVANASHELRTPLTVGRAMVELAMHRPDASSDLRTLGADLLALNARHEALISGLLDLAGAENGPIDRRPVDLADIVEHVADLTAPEAESAGVEVRTDVGETPTSGDAILLERLVANLVENGIRHNVAGGWVEARCRSVDEHAEVVVTNTGPEVPAYEVAELFQPFRRLDRDRIVVDRGVGLGLSIVEAIARAHHGSVTAQPREGGGLVVQVRVPG